MFEDSNAQLEWQMQEIEHSECGELEALVLLKMYNFCEASIGSSTSIILLRTGTRRSTRDLINDLQVTHKRTTP